MSATSTSPTSSRASRWPRRTPPKVTVRSARAAPWTVPLSRSTPVGPSTATSGTSRSSSRSRSAATGARGGPLAPVPSSASTARATVGHGPSGATSRTPSALASRAMRSRSSAPPSPGGAVTHTGTSSRWRARASTQPSPPLCPWPAATSTPPASRAANRGAIAARTARPAHSISVASSMPPATALRSQAADWSGVRTGSTGYRHVIPSEARDLAAGSEARGQDPSLRSG